MKEKTEHSGRHISELLYSIAGYSLLLVGVAIAYNSCKERFKVRTLELATVTYAEDKRLIDSETGIEELLHKIKLNNHYNCLIDITNRLYEREKIRKVKYRRGMPFACDTLLEYETD